MTRPRINRRYYIGVGAALALGAAIRAIYLYQISGSPFFDHFISDAAHFDRWARAITAGDLLGSGPFFRAPLYAYFLGLLYKLTGPDFLWIRLVQHAIGLGGVWATAAFARRVWNERVGVTAAFLAAVYPTAIFFESELLLDFLLFTLTPLILLQMHTAAHDGRARAAIGGGLLIGLFAVTRPTILVTVPILVAWVWWGRARVRSRRHGFASALLVLLGIAIIVLPVAVRNRVVGHDTILISSQGGVNFYIGNHPDADGVSAALPSYGTAWTNADAVAIAEAARGRPLQPSAVSGYWWEQGRAFWLEDPLNALRLLGRKLALFWQSTEFANNQSIDWFTERWGRILRWLPLSFGLIVAFGTLGWIVTVGSGGRIWVVVWSLAFALTVAMFFVVARFRLPVVPVWMGAAAAGAWWLFDRLRTRRMGRFVGGVGLVLALAVLGHIDWFDIRREEHPRSFLALGNVQLAEGHTAEARASFDASLAIDPEYRGVWLSRGTTFYLEGEVDSAAFCYRSELKYHPNDTRAQASLAQIALDRGDASAAHDLLDRILAVRPSDFAAAKMKAGLLRAQRRPEEALRILVDAGLTRYHFSDIAPLWGVILLDLGQLQEAERVYRRFLRVGTREVGVEADPDPDLFIIRRDRTHDRALANYNLGVIAGYQRDWRRATEHLGTAVSLNPGLGAAWSNLATAYLHMGAVDAALASAERAVALEARNPVYLFGLAMAQLADADTVAAIASLQVAMQADSLFVPAREIIEALDPAAKRSLRESDEPGNDSPGPPMKKLP